VSRPVIHVVDDDPAMRDSLRWLLKSDGLAVETYADAAEFLARFQPGHPGCLLLDVRMPGMSGLKLQEVLLERQIRIPLVFITAHADVPMAVRAVRGGALDFIEKPFDDEALIALIRRALEIDASTRLRNEQEIGFAARLSTLTPREREVLERIIAGGLNKVIARDLGITIKTVETHRARIMAKLGVNSVAELVERMVMHRLSHHAGDNQAPAG
jgi:FixJ family two-component response regulator